jgi:hypothetical protein
MANSLSTNHLQTLSGSYVPLVNSSIYPSLDEFNYGLPTAPPVELIQNASSYAPPPYSYEPGQVYQLSDYVPHSYGTSYQYPQYPANDARLMQIPHFVPPQSSAAAAIFNPSNPVDKRNAGSFGDKPIYEIVSTGNQYVVYEANPQTGRLIAMPYKGLHTLRSVQSIAIGALSLLSGAITAKVAVSFGAKLGAICLSTSLVGLSILGLGLWAVWGLNTSDPKAQLELRQKALQNKKIEDNHFTTPKEKRNFLFTKNYTSIKDVANDFRTLDHLHLLHDQEQISFTREILPIEAEFDYLEDLYNSKITPFKKVMQSKKSTAHNDYYHSSAVQTDRFIEETYAGAKRNRLENEGYSSTDAVVDGSYFAAKSLNSQALRNEAMIRERKLTDAQESFNQKERQIKMEINYEARLREIFGQTQSCIRLFRQNFNPSFLVCRDSNVSNHEESEILLR